MRLICPNCDAQYEVPENVIPDAGRDVQRSDCGNTWFQGPDQEASDQDETPFERQQLPSEVSEILHEEAEFEIQARAHEFDELASEDVDEDVGVSVDVAEPQEPETIAERRARETRERMARMRGVEANNPFVEASDSRKGVLPDVDAINSSLSPDHGAAQVKKTIDLQDLNRKRRRGSGFRTGFTISVFLGLLIVALYITHDNVGRAVPFAAPALDSLAEYVDLWRVWVEVEAANLMVMLEDLVADLLDG